MPAIFGNLTANVTRYNNAILLAQEVQPHVKAVWVSSLVFGSVLVVLALFLIVKSFKV